MNQKATAAVLGAGSLWGVISIFVRNLNAMGLTAITRAAVKKGYCDEKTREDTLEALKVCGLPTEIA